MYKLAKLRPAAERASTLLRLVDRALLPAVVASREPLLTAQPRDNISLPLFLSPSLLKLKKRHVE